MEAMEPRLLARLIVLSENRQPRDSGLLDGPDLNPPPLAFDYLSRLWHPARLLGEIATDGALVVLLQGPVQALGQRPDGGATINLEHPVHLLEDVLHRQQPDNRAVLVVDEGEVPTLLSHPAQDLIDQRRLGNMADRTH